MVEFLRGYFANHRESWDLVELQSSYSASAERIQILGGVASLIQVGQGHWIIHEIAYQDLVRKVS